MIGNHWITCKGDERGKYGRLIAVCYAGPYDLNAKMVRQGWAMAYRRYSMDYVEDEKDARDTRAGIWRGEFMPPSGQAKWRKLQCPAICLVKQTKLAFRNTRHQLFA